MSKNTIMKAMFLTLIFVTSAAHADFTVSNRGWKDFQVINAHIKTGTLELTDGRRNGKGIVIDKSKAEQLGLSLGEILSIVVAGMNSKEPVGLSYNGLTRRSDSGLSEPVVIENIGLRDIYPE